MTNRILKLTEIIDCIGLSRSTIYLKVSKGEFPKPINLSERAIGWLETDIDEWLEQQIEKSKNGGK